MAQEMVVAGLNDRLEPGFFYSHIKSTKDKPKLVENTILNLDTGMVPDAWSLQGSRTRSGSWRGCRGRR